MLETAAELELQGKFAVDGYALQIVGIIATTGKAIVIEEYGVDNIVNKIRKNSPYSLASIDGCYILMLKCGVDRDGVVKKLFDSPPRQKQSIVDSVIGFIDYSIDTQHTLLYDIKPPNLCRSPDKENTYKVVGLDFDPKYCINVGVYATQPRPNSVMKAYMFLMFACFQYQFGPKEPELIVALHNGFVRLKVSDLLDRIVVNKEFVYMLIRYLYIDVDYKPTDANIGFTPIEVRDILKNHYLDKIAVEAGIETLALAAAKAPAFEDSKEMDAGSRKKKHKRIKKKKRKTNKKKTNKKKTTKIKHTK